MKSVIISLFILLVSNELIACEGLINGNKGAFIKLDEPFSDKYCSSVMVYVPKNHRTEELASLSMIIDEDVDLIIPIDYTLAENIGKKYDAKGYVFTDLCLTENSLERVTLSADYTEPPTEDGTVTLCMTSVRYRLSEL